MSKSEGGPKTIFADTNIWLYAMLATQDPAKSQKAKEVIRENALVTSTQVINEVCVNLIKKAGFSEEQIQELVSAFYERHTVAQPGLATLLRASALRARYGFSYWDSTMLASALDVGSQIFYSEDMQDGFLVDKSLLIVNPFLEKVPKG
jgi:predicted nucleic acid-binding protein